MDFFARQDAARSQSLLLLLLFAVVLVLFGLAINGIAILASYFLSGIDSIAATARYAFVLTIALWAFTLLGCVFRYLDVKGGGKKLAALYGAHPVLLTSRDRKDRDLLDVVAEMALAASIPVPATYCLRSESSINAFVVGNKEEPVLVVTQGALDMLDREELQGVVGHEYGHIVNGDLLYNMRLLVALGGLNAIDEIGKRLLRGAGFFSASRSSLPGQGQSAASIPFLIAGVLLRLVGSLGVLGGNIVRAAFSRQREYLADATAVQFTRNSYALASALDRVAQYDNGIALHSEHVQELAHLCFQVPAYKLTLAGFLNTHPAVRKRIAAIDPHFSVKARKRKHKQADADTRTLRGVATAGSATSVGSAGSAEDGQQRVAGISDRFALFASDQLSCLAILFALFVPKDTDKAVRYFSAIGFAYNKEFKDKVKYTHETLGRELDVSKLRIIKYIAPTLSKLTADSRQQLLLNLEKIIDLEQENSLQTYAALQLLRRRLKAEIPVLDQVIDPDSRDKHPARRRSITELGKELSLLLSLMVEASGHGGERALRDYSRVLKCYTNEHYPMSSAEDAGIIMELERAFYALYQQPLPQRQAFVRHCAEIMLYDGIQMEQEKALLQLFAASLDVPELAVA